MRLRSKFSNGYNKRKMVWRLQENLQVVNRDFEPYRIDGKNKYEWVEIKTYCNAYIIIELDN